MDKAARLSSVDNALQLLSLFTVPGSIRVADASRALGLARSTTHRLLGTLETRGFARKDSATRAYLAGPALVRLGKAVTAESTLETAAALPAAELSARTRETVHAVALRGTDVAFVACAESPEILRTTSRVGTSVAAHVSTGGLATLSRLSRAQLHEMYPSEVLPPFRRQLFLNRAALFKTLEEVRRLGYAMQTGQNSGTHINVIAVPIVSGNTVYGALTVTGPEWRFSERRMQNAFQHVKRAADRVAAMLDVAAAE